MTNSNSSNSPWSKNDNSFWWLTSMVMLQRFWVLHSRAVLKNSLQLDRLRFFFLEKRYFIQCRKRKHSNHYLVAPCCKAFTEHILILGDCQSSRRESLIKNLSSFLEGKSETILLRSWSVGVRVLLMLHIWLELVVSFSLQCMYFIGGGWGVLSQVWLLLYVFCLEFYQARLYLIADENWQRAKKKHFIVWPSN